MLDERPTFFATIIINKQTKITTKVNNFHFYLKTKQINRGMKAKPINYRQSRPRPLHAGPGVAVNDTITASIELFWFPFGIINLFLVPDRWIPMRIKPWTSDGWMSPPGLPLVNYCDKLNKHVFHAWNPWSPNGALNSLTHFFTIGSWLLTE